MSDKTREITDLLSEASNSASDMTHGFKNIGDGDMKKGIQTVAEFFRETGETSGIKKGAIGGSVATLTVVGIIAVIKRIADKNDEHKGKGEKIIQGFRKGIEEAKLEENKKKNGTNNEDDKPDEEGQ